jgi:hypothetical protein
MSDNSDFTSQPRVDDPADSPTSTYRPPAANHNSYGQSAYSQTAASRPAWTQEQGWPNQTPERWFEPMPDEEAQRRAATVRRRRGQLVFVGGLVTVALFAATLSSVVTIYILAAGGYINHETAVGPVGSPGASAVTPAATATSAPIGDDVVSNAAAAVSPAVVTITTTATSTDPLTIGERHRVRAHLRRQRLDHHQSPCRQHG